MRLRNSIDSVVVPKGPTEYPTLIYSPKTLQCIEELINPLPIMLRNQGRQSTLAIRHAYNQYL